MIFRISVDDWYLHLLIFLNLSHSTPIHSQTTPSFIHVALLSSNLAPRTKLLVPHKQSIQIHIFLYSKNNLSKVSFLCTWHPFVSLYPFVPSPHEDGGSDLNEIQYRSKFLFTLGIRSTWWGPSWHLFSRESIHPLPVYGQLMMFGAYDLSYYWKHSNYSHVFFFFFSFHSYPINYYEKQINFILNKYFSYLNG